MVLNDVGSHLGSPIPRNITYVVTAFLSIALYNVLELTFLLFFTFKRRAGLYFWSCTFATWGIAIYSIGLILKDFDVATHISAFYVTLIIFGWCAMVTGQSLVLYSRLHLIVRRRAILLFVLTMIIVNAIILHIPTIILCYGANSVAYERFAVPYAIYERIQVTVFSIQEAIISGLYLFAMGKMFYLGGTVSEMHGLAGRRLMIHLVYMNVAVILLDAAIVILQYTGRYASQTAAKGLIYSVKLKLEFNILNRLVDVARRASDPGSVLPYGNRSVLHSGSGSGDTQQEEGHAAAAGDGGRERHRSWRTGYCPWNLFVSRVKHEISDPPRDG
ncbi:hypothetical protein BJX76DRAFT_366721 [Aspergillus varians]